MLKTIPVALFFVASQAAAGTIYKCTEGGKVSYHEQPCGKSAVALTVAEAPATAAPEAAERAARERALLQKLEDERAELARKEAQEARESARAEQVADAQRRRCHKARLDAKRADELVARAAARGNRSPEETRIWARRQAEAIAAECPT